MLDTATAEGLVRLVREIYQEPDGFIPLHEPRFVGRELEYVTAAIESTFVSSVGAYVDRFEEEIARRMGVRYAVATSSGTTALHTALVVAGVRSGDVVLTQPLTFVATGNAVAYTGATPVFIDVDRETLGLSPDALRAFLEEHAERRDDGSILVADGRRISACVPMHTFGLPARIEEILAVCEDFGIPVIEDAAESLGSSVAGRECGTFGRMGVLSLNGNKVITSGGGGAVLTDDEDLARAAKHLTTTAKVPHRWEYVHDQVGFNYRMPNLNAALACAQLESLSSFLEAKRVVADRYRAHLQDSTLDFVAEPTGARSNYWLNAVLTSDRRERDALLAHLNDADIMARPAWELLNRLPAFRDAPTGPLDAAEHLVDRIVNVPSSVPPGR